MDNHVVFFKALSDETRFKIVVLLSGGELCVCNIEESLGLSQAKVSRHLTVLRYSGLVKSRRQGQWIHYSLADSSIDIGKDIFKYFRNNLLKNGDAKQIANGRIGRYKKPCPNGRGNIKNGGGR
jgi:DNA-binding transcriptional ArsR family regulator